MKFSIFSSEKKKKKKKKKKSSHTAWESFVNVERRTTDQRIKGSSPTGAWFCLEASHFNYPYNHDNYSKLKGALAVARCE